MIGRHHTHETRRAGNVKGKGEETRETNFKIAMEFRKSENASTVVPAVVVFLSDSNELSCV